MSAKRKVVKSRSKNFLISLLASGLVFSTMMGCKSIDPYSGEEKTSSAVKFGAIGAAVCGIIGSRDSSKHARNAALGCGLIGASIGAYMDAQEKKLRKELAATGVSVKREGDDIRLIMPGNITFETNKSDVQQDFYPVLNSVAVVLKEYEKTIVEVEGHTDSTGSYQYNVGLSERRASEVSDYLKQGGVISQRLVVVGRGPAVPLASNDSAEGRAQNRRVEIRIRAIEAG